MFCIFAIIAFVQSKQLTLKSVLYAIDCGGQEVFSSEEGFLYGEDKYFSGDSRIADYTFNDVIQDGIKYTFNPRVYFTERHGTSFDYTIPIQKDGLYTIILQFVELYFEEENKRQFDVYIGARRILHDFSIIDDQHSKGSAKEVYIYIEIKDNTVLYKDQECFNGFDNGKLRISFRKGSSDLPKIDGIIVVKGHDADEEEKQILTENWEELSILHKQKKAEQQRIELEQQDLIVPDPIEQQDEEGLIDFLFTPIGLFIVIFGVSFFLIIAVLGGNDKKQQIQKKKL